MRLLGKIRSSQSPIYLSFAEGFDSLIGIDLPSRQSVILLISDSSEVNTRVIYSAAEYLLGAGLVYVCVWGDDCERVHDIFDEAEVGDGSVDRDTCFMSTWHNRDTLDEAIEFFLTCATPPECDLACTSYLAVVVGDQDLHDVVGQKIIAAEQGGETDS